MSQDQERYLISINVEGTDHEVIVDNLDTANLLLNDQTAALNYIKTLRQGDEVLEKQDNSNEASCSRPTIWSTKKQTNTDLQATQLLLKLRQQYSTKFDDQKSNKLQLWSEISRIIGVDYNLGPNGGERCRQKFSNLLKPYYGYIKAQKTTGEGKIEKEPPFFEEIHCIMGSKHKVQPSHLKDSREDVQEEREEADKVEQKANHRFSNVQKRVTPPTKTESVLWELKEQRANSEKQFDFLKQHLQKSEEQRDRFLNIMEHAFRKRKRHHAHSSDSDE